MQAHLPWLRRNGPDDPPAADPRRTLARRIGFLPWALVAISVLLSGCVSAKYKTAAEKTPTVPLNLTGEQAPLRVTVQSVIVYRGPGSWKRDAYWDEYLVALDNQGGTPATLETVSLTDFTGTLSTPSDNPWLLEKQSRTREEQLKANLKDVSIQVGGNYVGFSLAATGAMAAGGFLGGVLVVPVYLGGAIYANVHHRHQIEDEFARRHIVLPAVIAPGETRQGSLFFRISPAPRQISFLVQHDGTYQKIAVELAPLAGLHLKAQAER